MSKRALVLLAATVLAVPGLAACSDDEGSVSQEGGTPSASGTGSGSGTGSASGTGGAEGAGVTVEGTAFKPPAVTAKTGAAVTWTFKDSFAHTVTADDNSFDSGSKQAGATFAHTFTRAGTFAYHCTIHPSMKGTVTVS